MMMMMMMMMMMVSSKSEMRVWGRILGLSPVSIQTQSLACVRCVNENRKKRKLLAACNASACVSCGFRLRNARNASDCV